MYPQYAWRHVLKLLYNTKFSLFSHFFAVCGTVKGANAALCCGSTTCVYTDGSIVVSVIIYGRELM